MADRLDGQVALVTGGGRGIGTGIARELADAGMRVAVSARSRDDVERMVTEVERGLGPIDLLVNNAGIAVWEERAWEVPVEDWWHVFEVNVLGPYLCCRAVISGMIERERGRIVNTGSGSGYLPGQRTTAYGGSKAALYRVAEGLAVQLESYGIAVFTISPGLVKT